MNGLARAQSTASIYETEGHWFESSRARSLYSPALRGNEGKGQGMLKKRVFVAGAAVAGVFALTAATPAMGSTAQRLGTGLIITAGPLEANDVTITKSGADVVVTDTAGVTDVGGCTQNNGTQVTCSAPTVQTTVSLGDLNDKMQLAGGVSTPFYLVNAGAGDDRIDLSGDTAPVGGLDGINGDAGNDVMTATPSGTHFDDPCATPPQGPCGDADLGDDVMNGGPGSDRLWGLRGSDTMVGGGSFDWLIGVIRGRTDHVEDGAVDSLDCGDGPDLAYLGQGDSMTLDCEQAQQETTCPAGASCEGRPTVTAVPPAVGKSATAAAKKKRKATVIGKGQKEKLSPGSRAQVSITINSKLARKVLGKRASMKATFNLGLDRVRKGKRVGRTKRKVRFAMNR